MTYLTEDVDVHNEQVLEARVSDFHSFVSQGNFEGAEAILDNLKDLGEWEKATELLTPFFKAKMMKRMVVPADYGEKNTLEEVSASKLFGVIGAQHDVIMDALKKEVEEEVIL